MARLTPRLALFLLFLLLGCSAAHAQSLRITEFLATNVTGIVDEDGTHQGWIEIWNFNTTTKLSLSGVKLSNGTITWSIPAVEIMPDEHLIIWASGKNRTVLTAPLHTNFTIPPAGGTLTLLNAANTPLSQLNYPAQQPDVSWGRDETDGAVVGTQVGAYTTPSPGERNNYSGPGVAGRVLFDKSSQAFTGTMTVTLSQETPDAAAQIRYTTNGTLPVATSLQYTSPIAVSSTVLIRARVFKTGLLPGETESNGYLLLDGTTSTFSSAMPMMVLTNFGLGQPPDTTDQAAYLWVWEPAAPDNRSRFTNAPTLVSRVVIDRRGSSTIGNAKYNLNLETRKPRDDDDRKVSLLGMPSHSDWILSGPFDYDHSEIHNPFIYAVSNSVGRYAPRVKEAEVFMDVTGGALNFAGGASGDYFGIYNVIEKIRRGSSRVDISALNTYDNGTVQKTGGYIYKVDRLDSGDSGFTAGGQSMAYYYPKEVEVKSPQRDPQEQYLTTYINNFNSALQSATWNNPTTGYAAYLDVPEAIDHHLLNVWPFNLDAFRLSGYWHKERGGKLIPGPIWDYDRTMSSTDGRDANPAVWRSQTGDFGTDFFNYTWWNRLFLDIDFYQKYIDRWQELRRGPMAPATINALLDSLNAEISAEAINRDLARWAKTKRAWTSPFTGQNFPASQAAEVQRIKDYLQQRANFMDSQWVGPVNSSVAEGNVPTGTQVTLTGPSGATIYYTLNGADPRPNGGSAPGAGVLTYAAGTPITISATTRLRARAYNPTFTALTGPNNPPLVSRWGGLTNVRFAVDPPVSAGTLAVTEISYHPSGPSAAELLVNPLFTDNDFEFIEVRNIGNTTIDLGNAQFTSGIKFTFSGANAVSLAPNAYLVIGSNPAAFVARYGSSIPIVGGWSGDLANEGEELIIKAADGTKLLDFTYNDAWYRDSDGTGASLEYIGTSFTNADYNNPANWRASSEVNGNPGVAGSGPDTRIVINEILSNTSLPRVDAIELFNPGADPVDVSGWFISDLGSATSADAYKQFRIPNGTIIAGGAYQVFTEVNFNPNGLWNPTPGTRGAGEFAFDGDHGDDAFLIAADASGKLLRFVDHVKFGAARQDESWGRLPNGTGRLFPMAHRTLLDEASATVPLPGLGAANSGPRVGPLVITEVQHTPGNDNPALEFVEIHNPTSVDQPLAHWNLGGDVHFAFTTEMIPAGGVLVVTAFSPADAAKAEAFRTAYGLSANASLVLAGPWTTGDRLISSGNIILYRGEAAPVTDPTFFPQTIEDQTQYLSDGTWPVTTTGLSLNRTLPASFGNDPASWTAGIPIPGRTTNTAPIAKADTLHVPLTAGALVLNVRDNDSDADNDNLTITQVGTPANGTVTTDGAVLQYVPGATYTGNDSFSYTISDGFGGTSTAVVTLVNAAPLVVNDSLHIPLNGSDLMLNVEANDSDADNDSLTIVTLGTPSHGTATTNGTAITYTPGQDFTGTDQFSYTVQDGYGGIATGVVLLANSAPVAVDDAFHPLIAAVPFTFDVRANDSDADSDPRTIVAVGLAAHGTAATDGNVITYAPDASFQGADSFSYQINDGFGGVASATVRLVNAGPVAVNDTAISNGVAVTVDVLANDLDADSDPLTVVSVGAATGGVVTTSASNVTYTPGADFSGDDSFTYTIADGHGGMATATVTIQATEAVAQSAATTGTEVPGAPGMVYASLQVPAIGDDLMLAWLASVKDSKAKRKTLLVAGRPATALFGVGDNVPGSSGLKFTKIGTPVVDGDGKAVFIGTFNGTGADRKPAVGVFSTTPGGATTMIARTGAPAADASGGIAGTFIKFRVVDASGSETLYVADLAAQFGTGVWAWDGSVSRLVLKTGTNVTTPVGFKSVKTISLLGAVPGSPGHDRSHRAGEIAMSLGFSDHTSGVGVAQWNGTAWVLVVNTVSGQTSSAGGAFKAFGAPTLSGSGTAAALVTLVAPQSQNTAVELLAPAGDTVIAREGQFSPISGAAYKSFSDPVANDDGSVAFTAALKGGTAPMALFLRNPAGELTSIAGLQQPATGAPGATWKRFLSFALPAGPNAGPIFLASLGGGVNQKNNLGLWATNSQGVLVLAARTGFPPSAGSSKILKKMVLLNALPPAQGSARSFNATQRIAYLATFTDGTQAIEVVRIP